MLYVNDKKFLVGGPVKGQMTGSEIAGVLGLDRTADVYVVRKLKWDAPIAYTEDEHFVVLEAGAKPPWPFTDKLAIEAKYVVPVDEPFEGPAGPHFPNTTDSRGKALTTRAGHDLNPGGQPSKP